MTDNNLFAIEQYGFRSGHSTELAALHLIDYLTKQMDVGEIPINIYIDLSKAFDTLDHKWTRLTIGKASLLWNPWSCT